MVWRVLIPGAVSIQTSGPGPEGLEDEAWPPLAVAWAELVAVLAEGGGTGSYAHGSEPERTQLLHGASRLHRILRRRHSVQELHGRRC